MRYQRMAKEGLEAALGGLAELKQRVGEGEVEGRMRGGVDSMAVLVADCQLKRDQLGASIRRTQQRQAANEVAVEGA